MYKIAIGKNLDIGNIVAPIAANLTKRCFLVTNSKVAPLYLKKVAGSLKKRGISVVSEILPDGEKYKNLNFVKRLYGSAVRNSITRKCFAVALGGGVIGDLTGFFAATFMRGIEFVQIPTTLLAMVDASIGGKTGVDIPEGKNLVGAFKNPLAVIEDVSFLKTLPPREMKNGLAEIVKYAFLDRKFFGILASKLDRVKRGDEGDLTGIILRSVQIKTEVVRKDFREAGLRRILNLGHTIGHAIEAASGYRIRHGEAVASGIVYETDFGNFLGICSDSVRKTVIEFVREAGFRPVEPDWGKIAGFIKTDKKVIDRKPVFVFIERIGTVKIREVFWRDFEKWVKKH
ncbi:MAG: 3-dehydroquinate synthase [Elusimicrobia bacterium]|nr:3-dehydroquinate synthase [Elusimicrobiota bacterium]